MSIDVKACFEAVHRPGKFEGAWLGAPYYYEQSLEGGGTVLADQEEDGAFACVFTDVSAEEREALGIAPQHSAVLLIEDSDGFVYASSCTGELEAIERLDAWLRRNV